MGRKIPAKKHHGVKDPLIQQARRLASIKNKINQPPVNPDDQPVPKSLLRLFGVERAKGPRRVRGAGRARGGAAVTSRSRSGVSALRRLPGESARSFSQRISGAVAALHHDPHHSHYPHEDEDSEPERDVRRRRRCAGGGEGGDAGGGGERDTRARRRRQQRRDKIQKLAKDRLSEVTDAPQYERVPFGDIAHAPPALHPPRKAKHKSARQGLLLAGAVEGAATGGAMELRRLAAVTAYRDMKAKRALIHSHRTTTII